MKSKIILVAIMSASIFYANPSAALSCTAAGVNLGIAISNLNFAVQNGQPSATIIALSVEVTRARSILEFCQKEVQDAPEPN